jgi:hypothetical protein
MSKELPTWCTLAAGLLLIVIFTGTWVLLNDIRRALDSDLPLQRRRELTSFFARLRVRRVLALLAGIGLVVLFILGRSLTVLTALVFGVFWLHSLYLVSLGRELLGR